MVSIWHILELPSSGYKPSNGQFMQKPRFWHWFWIP